MQGTVRKVHERGFAFIAGDDGRDYFLHVYSMADDTPFDETLQERRISFDVEQGEKGPKAIRVRAI